MDNNTPPISKEQFVKVLTFMKEQDAKFEALINKMEELSPGFYCDFLPNLSYNEQLISLLNLLLREPDNENSLIEYFIYETEYGAAATDDDSTLAFKTPEELYDLLVYVHFNSTQTVPQDKQESE